MREKPPGQTAATAGVAAHEVRPRPPAARKPGVLLVALGASLWGTDTVLRRPLAGPLSSLTIVLYEHVILAALLLPVCIAARNQWKKLSVKQWAAVLGIAWGGSALATVLFTQAIKLGNPTAAVLLQKLQPLFAVLLAGLLLGERLRRAQWIYLGVAVVAAYLVSFGDRGLRAPFAAGSAAQARAALLAAGAALLWGASTVLGRFLARSLSFSAITALRIVAALPLLLLLGVFQNHGRLPTVAEGQFLSLLLLALVPGLAALLIYYRGLRTTPASLAAIAELCFPAAATVLNWAFLDARVTAVQIAGFLVLWAVIAQLQRR